MARTKRWVWSGSDRGYAEVRLSSWKYFTDFVYQEMLDYETYVWRGQRRDDWKLEPKIERLIGDGKMSSSRRHKFITSHLEQFKYAVRGRRGPTPPLLEHEDDWWALGQHHGLATPLLDWSASPFVAAFFAFIEVGEKQTRNRAVFALHRPTVESRARLRAREENARRREQLSDGESGKVKLGIMQRVLLQAKADPEVTFVRPLSDENQRLVNQGGLFTRLPQGKSLGEWVQENYDEELDTGSTLIKIFVPNKDRDNALRTLNRMNINHLSLFPDLYGASKFCNLFAEIERY